MNDDNIAAHRALLAAHRRTLAVYLQRLALVGAAHVPPEVANGIADARTSIAQIKADLRAAGADVDDQPDDEDPAEAAKRRLVALSFDTIPDVAPLPPASRMPLARNPLFVGRDDELKVIAHSLLDGGYTGVAISAATGMGGIGKSNFATEFVHRYGQFFGGGVFWLSFDEAANVPAEIAACGGPGAMNLPGFDTLKQADQVSRVRQEWQSPIPRLLIFDNCEDESLLDAWRPTTGGCRVLVTSRRAQWAPVLGVTTLPLSTLSRAESVVLLRKSRPDLAADDPDLDAIAAELGDLPLALHLAGSFLHQYRADATPAEYLAELRSAALLAHDSLQGLDLTFSPTNHPLHISRTFALSYERLRPGEPVDTLALALFARAACFAPGEPLARDLLLATVELPDNSTRRRASRGLTRLVNLGLLEEEGPAMLRVHRMVAAFVISVAKDSVAQEAVEEALIDAVERVNQAGKPAAMQPILIHLRHVTQMAMGRADIRLAALCRNLGKHLRQIADYTAAQPLLMRALQIDEQVRGPEHPATADNLINLASLLLEQGDYSAARPLYERALDIREQVLGPNHPDTAQSLSYLGGLLSAQGDYAAARPLRERALQIEEQTLGPDHGRTAHSLTDLGALLYHQGDYAAARPLLERALQIREQMLGPDHPLTAQSLFHLGGFLHMQALAANDVPALAAARPLYERAVQIHEQALGPNHPTTATSLHSLGALLYHQGDYAAARPLLERALQIREQALGPNHPGTADSLDNLALLRYAQGDYAAAGPLIERALRIREQTLGASHPRTATSLNILGQQLQAQGDLQAARSYFERALAIWEQVLGVEHSKTRMARENLAALDQLLLGTRE